MQAADRGAERRLRDREPPGGVLEASWNTLCCLYTRACPGPLHVLLTIIVFTYYFSALSERSCLSHD